MSNLEIIRNGESYAILEDDQEINVGRTGISIYWGGGEQGTVYIQCNKSEDHFEIDLEKGDGGRLVHLDRTGPSIDVYTKDFNPKPYPNDILLKRI